MTGTFRKVLFTLRLVALEFPFPELAWGRRGQCNFQIDPSPTTTAAGRLREQEAFAHLVFLPCGRNLR